MTIGLGTTILPNPDDQRTFQIAYGAGCGGLLLLLVVALHVDKAVYQGPPKEVDNEIDDPESN